ncbi:MAG: ABC transporter ATP-binding protein [Oscillospiraceae bacterium]|nr:ABC transporter ATP-binding protein [Oscillospiraceae bacterium]
MAFVEFRDVKKVYDMSPVRIEALSGVNFVIEKGEICVIVGASGAGKTTLLNILGGMDFLTSGSVTLDGKRISDYDKRSLTEYRRLDVGFVFQFYNLIPNLTAVENVEIAARLCREPMDSHTVLQKVGLGDRCDNFPAQLSGGEQQRVAIARAIVKRPKLILCDEPTGALDYNTGKTVLQFLQDTAKREGMTAVIITHNTAITAMADRVISLRSGKVDRVTLNEKPARADELEW